VYTAICGCVCVCVFMVVCVCVCVCLCVVEFVLFINFFARLLFVMFVDVIVDSRFERSRLVC
jgi:hypothetical protein